MRIPQVMAFSEAYSALQQGVVDGTENAMSNFYTQKMHEVQKHLTLSDHGYILYAVIVNKKFWDGLPPDVRTALEQAMKDATRYARQIALKENQDALAAVKAAGTTEIYLLPDKDRLSLATGDPAGASGVRIDHRPRHHRQRSQHRRAGR